MSQIKGQIKIDGVKVRSPNKPKTEPTPELVAMTTQGQVVKKISEVNEVRLEAKKEVAKKATKKRKKRISKMTVEELDELLKDSMLDGQIRLDDFSKIETDTIATFRRIEEELIDEIMRNLRIKPATSVTRFQIEQLQRLEQFRQNNLKKYSSTFSSLNDKIAEMITYKHYEGLKTEEKRIIMAVQNGYSAVKVNSVQAQKVYDVNKKKLEALIKATTDDMVKAEHAVLRQAHDAYRSIIYDAQVALNTGSMPYDKAIDMATKDLLNNGIKTVTYKNGAVHTVGDYADMALKTANKRAYLIGEGQKRQEMGCHFVIVGKRGGAPCKCCVPYIGKVLVDDVYSGGTAEEARKYGYPLMSEAMKNGLFHPRCKDGVTTYFPQLTKLPKKITREEAKEIDKKEQEKQKQNYNNRQAKKYERLGKYSMQKENKQAYKAKAKEYKKK